MTGPVDETQAEICEALVDLHPTHELSNGGWRVGESATGEVLHEHLHRLALVATEIVDLGECEPRERSGCVPDQWPCEKGPWSGALSTR